MPETSENWFGPLNNCIYYACQTPKIYQVLPYSVDFKAPGELSKTVPRGQYLVNIVLFRIKDL